MTANQYLNSIGCPDYWQEWWLTNLDWYSIIGRINKKAGRQWNG